MRFLQISSKNPDFECPNESNYPDEFVIEQKGALAESSH